MEKFVCKICGKEVERSNKAMNMGNLCNSCRQRYRQLKMKQKAIDYLGGKCSVCGYDKCNDALDFHHKHIGMYDNNNYLVKDFSSLSEAGQYAEANFEGRSGRVSKDNATTKIRECVHGRQKTSYGYIWKEIKD